jgi:prepilin-type N-terminal cleavage/methylation domain
VTALGFGRQTGFALLEAVVAIVLLSILVALAVPRYLGYLADRSLQNAAHLIQADLRLTQQTAIARAGSGPRAEACFRTTGTPGYDVYAVDFTDNLARTGERLGPTVKAANAGQEYPAGITVTITPAPSAACASGVEGQPVAFSGAGTPIVGANPAPTQTVTLSLRGRSYRVVITETTGRTMVMR